MGGVWSGWKDRQRSSVRGERGGKDEGKKRHREAEDTNRHGRWDAEADRVWRYVY